VLRTPRSLPVRWTPKGSFLQQEATLYRN
jgi:hypothetical protein